MSGLQNGDAKSNSGVHPEGVSRVLPLAFLSPRIVEAILTGQQPADLTARHLARSIELPIGWAARTSCSASEIGERGERDTESGSSRVPSPPEPPVSTAGKLVEGRTISVILPPSSG